MRIVYMGTPEFASVLLESLVSSGEHDVAAVVTVPDKAVGRGLKLTPSAVKQVALAHGLPLLQPEKLRDPAFLEMLASYRADLFLVVAFRMLPEAVWRMPSKGTVNLHASLLPKYRGAAPIQRAIMNGERETGVTAFMINGRLDEGGMLLSTSVPIATDMTGGELHDALLAASGPLMFEVLRRIERNDYTLSEQPSEVGMLPTAPKIFREDCRIRWENPSETIYNQIRALSPYPGAFTMVRRKDGHEPVLLKIFRAGIEKTSEPLPVGNVRTDNRQKIWISASDGNVVVEELQLFGKRRMSVREFLAGNRGFDGAQCVGSVEEMP